MDESLASRYLTSNHTRPLESILRATWVNHDGTFVWIGKASIILNRVASLEFRYTVSVAVSAAEFSRFPTKASVQPGFFRQVSLVYPSCHVFGRHDDE